MKDMTAWSMNDNLTAPDVRVHLRKCVTLTDTTVRNINLNSTSQNVDDVRTQLRKYVEWLVMLARNMHSKSTSLKVRNVRNVRKYHGSGSGSGSGKTARVRVRGKGAWMSGSGIVDPKSKKSKLTCLKKLKIALKNGSKKVQKNEKIMKKWKKKS